MSGSACLPALVDIGINLSHDSYDADREAVLRRALDAGVEQMVVTGASISSSRDAQTLVDALPQVLRATAGCHPHHAIDLDAAAFAELATLARAPTVVAVGECGLDYHRNFSSPAEQRSAFERQIALAIDLGKPLFLHSRDAHRDFMAMLRAHEGQLPPAVLHCFTGTADELDDCLAFGLSIGITGWICDERRGLHLRGLVGRIPPGRLMIETDGPYLLPRDLVPKPASRRNEPMYLPHVARTVATARGESIEELARHTTRTAREFFGLPWPPAPSAT
ncbi:MAG: TatD family hydrolase [Xanthomonadales bacterium]|nr:TatD family hydrolase [Xanthomonadales bacterium]